MPREDRSFEAALHPARRSMPTRSIDRAVGFFMIPVRRIRIGTAKSNRVGGQDSIEGRDCLSFQLVFEFCRQIPNCFQESVIRQGVPLAADPFRFGHQSGVFELVEKAQVLDLVENDLRPGSIFFTYPELALILSHRARHADPAQRVEHNQDLLAPFKSRYTGRIKLLSVRFPAVLLDVDGISLDAVNRLENFKRVMRHVQVHPIFRPSLNVNHSSRKDHPGFTNKGLQIHGGLLRVYRHLAEEKNNRHQKYHSLQNLFLSFFIASPFSRASIVMRLTIVLCRLHKIPEEGMRVDCPRLKLRMKLSGDKPRMTGKLDNLDQRIVRCDAAEDHPVVVELLSELVVHFKAVPMTLVDKFLLVRSVRLGPFRQETRVCSQTHRSAHCFDALLVQHEINDIVPGVLEFRAVFSLHVAHVARELNHRTLQPKAYAEERNVRFPNVPDGGDFPLNSAFPEAARDEGAARPL